MFRHLRFVILATTVMPVSLSLADGLPAQHRTSSTPPLILVQSDASNLCQRRCEFDYQTCAKLMRENADSYGVLPGNAVNQILEAQLEGCATKRRYCFRNCDRP